MRCFESQSIATEMHILMGEESLELGTRLRNEGLLQHGGEPFFSRQLAELILG
jgi:hypothetical protein